jgi:hypothetical protein
MRSQVFICDNCNADMTDAVRKYGEWQGLYRVSGGLADFNTPDSSHRVEIDACSIPCLLAAVAKAADNTVTPRVDR